jgi:hypothetical protein
LATAGDAAPVPERLTLCGLPLASSVKATAALREPLAVGLKVTLILQLPPAVTLDPQPLVWAKSPALAPVMAMLVTIKVEAPELLRVIVCAALVVPTAWLAKVRVAGERLAAAPVAAPVPERLTLCGLPAALSVKATAAERDPLAVGLNVTLILQFAPAATLDPQLLVWLKSLALLPLTAMLDMSKAAPPELVRVMDCAVLAVWKAWLPKVRAADEKLTSGLLVRLGVAELLAPIPERLMAWGLPETLSNMSRLPLRVPFAVGAKITPMAQFLPTASVDPQLFDWVKSPLTPMLEISKVALPVFDRDTRCILLVLPTA